MTEAWMRAQVRVNVMSIWASFAQGNASDQAKLFYGLATNTSSLASALRSPGATPWLKLGFSAAVGDPFDRTIWALRIAGVSPDGAAVEKFWYEDLKFVDRRRVDGTIETTSFTSWEKFSHNA